MKEYICKEDLIKATEETPFTMSMCLNKDECNGANIARLTFAKIFKVFPAADVVEVRHGKWIEENTRPRSSQFCCSVCHRTAYDPQPTRVKDWKKRCRYAYCPNCGAKMTEV